MAFRLRQGDRRILETIADYRVLRVRQLAVLFQRNVQALRRRLQELADQGLVLIASPGFGPKRGRPERLLSLGPEGVSMLKTSGVLDHGLPDEGASADGIRCLDHQLLVNDFRVHLAQMQHLLPGLSVDFLSPCSCPVPRHNGLPIVPERVLVDERTDQWLEFTPDGVFAVTHAELGKTLLFFLEADRGTETLVSSQRPGEDIRRKLVNYQTYFRRGGYRRYEGIWNCRLRGFRLLFLAHTPVRSSRLCKLVRRTPPSDFIWLTDHASLLSKGVWAAIWHRGGREGGATESILGSQAPSPSPRPAALV